MRFLFAETCPLQMVRLYGEVPELEGNRYLVGADGPDALLGVLDEMRNALVKAPALE